MHHNSNLLWIDEPIELTSTLLADSFAENIDLQSAILESIAIDPEGGDISFTLSGEGSENFSVDANGNISLQTELDYDPSLRTVLTANCLMCWYVRMLK